MAISLMKTISPYHSELIALLRTELELSENALIKQEGKLSDDYPIRFDLIIEDGGKTYVIEIKRIVRLEALSRFGLLKLLLNADNISVYDIEFVIVGNPSNMGAIQSVARGIAGVNVEFAAQEKPLGMANALRARLVSCPKSRLL